MATLAGISANRAGRQPAPAVVSPAAGELPEAHNYSVSLAGLSWPALRCLRSLPDLAATLALTAVALIVGGMVVGRLTGRPVLRSGLRQLALGGMAIAVTYAVGHLIGSNGADGNLLRNWSSSPAYRASYVLWNWMIRVPKLACSSVSRGGRRMMP